MSLSVMIPYESMRFFLLRDQICLFPLLSTLFAAELCSDGNGEKHEKELKQRMRDDSLRGEDEHIRQETSWK